MVHALVRACGVRPACRLEIGHDPAAYYGRWTPAAPSRRRLSCHRPLRRRTRGCPPEPPASPGRRHRRRRGTTRRPARGGGGSAATRCVMATRVPLASVAPATTARFAASAAAKRTHAAPPPATSAHASTAPCGSSSVATWALVAETARPDTTTTRPAGPAPRENRANVVPRTSTAAALTVFARRVGDAAASVRRSARAEASSSPSLSTARAWRCDRYQVSTSAHYS